MGASGTKEPNKNYQTHKTYNYQNIQPNNPDFNNNNYNNNNFNNNNFSRSISAQINREPNFGSSSVNLDKVEVDFQKTHKCNYNINELKNLLLNFINNKTEQHYSYIQNEGEVDKNDPFYLLRQYEEEKLTNILNSKKNTVFAEIKNQLNSISPEYDYISLVNKIVESQNGKKIYYEKFLKQIDNINNNHQSPFEIDYLTIMLVGKSGVGKSTLINSLLKLKGGKKARTGTGNFVTEDIRSYQSDALPYIKLVDTRGIELSSGFGAKEIEAMAKKYISEQYNTKNPNNFVHCIWYCITGNRFEQVEIDFLNALRSAYNDNNIPILVIYTQATDKKTIAEMQRYIKDKKIEASFIQVLAERKELVTNQFMEPFGLSDLMTQSLEKTKKALKGEMRSVMTNNISTTISASLKKENSYINTYSFENVILKFCQEYNNLLSDDNCLEYIIRLFCIYLENLFGKCDYSDISKIFRREDLIRNTALRYLDKIKTYLDKILNPILSGCSVDFINYQVKIQKKTNRPIEIQKQRTIEEFNETSKKFLSDYYLYIAQINLIIHFITLICPKFSNCLGKTLEKTINEITKNSNIQESVSDCFLNKFAVYEKKLNSFLDINKDKIDSNNNDFNNFDIGNNFPANNFNNFNNDNNNFNNNAFSSNNQGNNNNGNHFDINFAFVNNENNAFNKPNDGQYMENELPDESELNNNAATPVNFNNYPMM